MGEKHSTQLPEYSRSTSLSYIYDYFSSSQTMLSQSAAVESTLHNRHKFKTKQEKKICCIKKNWQWINNWKQKKNSVWEREREALNHMQNSCKCLTLSLQLLFTWSSLLDAS